VSGNPNVKIQNRILKSKTLNLFQGKVQNDILVMPNQVLNLIQDLTISASLQGRLVSASHEPDPEPTRETSSGHSSG